MTKHANQTFRDRDFLAGLLFLAIGCIGLTLSLGHSFGTASRMGPGYFPTLVSAGLMAIGAIIIGRSFLKESDPVRIPSLRPLIFVVGSTFCFAWMLERWGLIASVIALIGLARLAESPLKIRQTSLLVVGMAILSVLVFYWGLRLPFRLFPG